MVSNIISSWSSCFPSPAIPEHHWTILGPVKPVFLYCTANRGRHLPGPARLTSSPEFPNQTRPGCRVALPGTLTASCGWKVGELVLVIRCARKLCYLLLSCFGFLRQIQVSQSCFCEIVLSVTILLVNSAQFLAHLQLFWKVSVKMVAEMTPGWNWPWSIFRCEFDSRDQL